MSYRQRGENGAWNCKINMTLPERTSLYRGGISHQGLESYRRKLEADRGKDQREVGQTTDDDLTQINGKREQFEGKLQERYGLAKDKVRTDVDTWLNSMD